MVETLRAHGVDKETALARCHEVLAQVGLPDPARVEGAFPYELSGGMLQRVMIAIALAVSPVCSSRTSRPQRSTSPSSNKSSSSSRPSRRVPEWPSSG